MPEMHVSVSENIDLAFDSDGCVDVVPSNDAEFNNVVEFYVSQKNGKGFHVVDYSSAGKTWDEKSKMAAWLPVATDK